MTHNSQPTTVLATDAVSCKVYRHGKPADAPRHFDEISEVLREEGALVWFDAVDPDSQDLEVLREEFRLHPLAIEDAVQSHQRPKIESYTGYWFLIVLATSLDQSQQVILHEIAIFAGEKFLVTVRHEPAFPLEEIEARWHAHPEGLARGGGFLLYTILDTVVDGYFPVVETFQERVDALEETLFDDEGPDKDVVRRIFAMKRNGQSFRHAVMPMRDILNPIIRGDVDILDEEEMPYFRDVYDHTVRIIDNLDSLRDLVSSALEIHLSVVANRQNEVAKQLTVIATIFLPLSFLVGFFGQNFDFLVQHITGPGAFWLLAVGTEIGAVIILLGYFKKKGWY